MRILAIDTSTRIQAIALVDAGTQLARRHHIVRVNHAATLLRNIHDMLDQHSWTVADLDLVAVGVGPGSFTGLRVGLANAKAIARAAAAPIAGISSLEAVARPVCDVHDGFVVSAIDARRGEVYTQSYQSASGSYESISDSRTSTPGELRDHILELEGEAAVLVVGSGVQAFESDLGAWPDGVRVRALSGGWSSPSPFSIAMLGRSRVLENTPDDLNVLEPDYIRLSDAEISWNERNPPAQKGA